MVQYLIIFTESIPEGLHTFGNGVCEMLLWTLVDVMGTNNNKKQSRIISINFIVRFAIS